MAEMTDEQKQRVFAELVGFQDAGKDVKSSRLAVALKYGLDLEDVKRVERAGLDGEWPPL